MQNDWTAAEQELLERFGLPVSKEEEERLIHEALVRYMDPPRLYVVRVDPNKCPSINRKEI